MRSNGPIMLALPPFRGMTRKLILIAMAAFVVVAVANSFHPGSTMALILTPALALGRMPWQFLTYAFLAQGLLNTAFALLSVWFFGSALEDERGSRWLLEYLLTSAIGGGLLAALLSLVHPLGRVYGSAYSSVFGLWPVVMALLLAFARMNPEAEMRLYFVLKVKAKYLAAIFLGFYLVSALISHDPFSAVTALCVALCGFLFLRFVPRKGFSYAASEGWFGIRNSFYRAKRRRAARKFTVYMREQGKEVNLDPSGRYVDPDRKTDPTNKTNPKDKSWMN